MSFGRSLPLTLLGAALVVACPRGGPESAAPAGAPDGAALDSAIVVGERMAVERLPAGSGRDLVLSGCLLCHGASIVSQQRKDSAAWARSVAQMVTWGAPVPADRQPELVAYLAAYFGHRR